MTTMQRTGNAELKSSQPMARDRRVAAQLKLRAKSCRPRGTRMQQIHQPRPEGRGCLISSRFARLGFDGLSSSSEGIPCNSAGSHQGTTSVVPQAVEKMLGAFKPYKRRQSL